MSESCPIYDEESHEDAPNGGYDHGEDHYKLSPSHKTGAADNIDDRLNSVNLINVVRGESRERGHGAHHLESMNSFYRDGAHQIITQGFKIDNKIINKRDEPEDREIAEYEYSVRFIDAALHAPVIPNNTADKNAPPQLMYPNYARINNLTYACPLYINVHATVTARYVDTTRPPAVVETTVENIYCGGIPCAVKSEMCNLYHCSRESIKGLREDPNDPGGYFIAGNEYIINGIENVINNIFNVFKNKHQKEVARGQMLSKPGDHFENSQQIILRLYNNHALTVEVSTLKRTKLELPFYVLFRMFGMASDREIIDHIVYGVDNVSNNVVIADMTRMLARAFAADYPKYAALKDELNPLNIISFLAHQIHIMENIKNNAAQNQYHGKRRQNIDTDALKYFNKSLLSNMDRYFLPHAGQTEESRIKKLRFLGHMINRLLAVEMGIVDSTKRDEYDCKRIAAAGTSYAKMFKTIFNISVVGTIRQSIHRALTKAPFSVLKLDQVIKDAVKPENLEKAMVATLQAGDKTRISINRKDIVNHINATQAQRKNDVYFAGLLATINAPSNVATQQASRAEDIRAIPTSAIGYICPSYSPEGATVGLPKAMTPSTSITPASDSNVMKLKLLEDPDVIALDLVSPREISQRKLFKVFVNGDWIGCCERGHELVKKYRSYRRNSQLKIDNAAAPLIGRYTTIVWEALVREVKFWVDVGRLIAPKIIVYNNLEEYDAAAVSGAPIQFQQWIKLTYEHIVDLIGKRISMHDLADLQVLEYISPEEMENCYIAESIDVLRDHQYDRTCAFTHMEISQSCLSLITMCTPATNFSNPIRGSYAGCQRKQCAGWYAINYEARIDKNVCLQHYCERPLVSTFADTSILPSGMNCIVALMLHGGQNQEDSVTLNQSSIDAGMFNASYYTYELTRRDKNEVFGVVETDQDIHDRNRSAVKEYLQGNFARVGTQVKRNYVLVVKTAKIHENKAGKQYADKSVVYMKDEPAVVCAVVPGINRDGEDIVKTRLRTTRHAGVGEKLCLTPDHEVMTAKGWKNIADITMMDFIWTHDLALGFRRPIEVIRAPHDGAVMQVSSVSTRQIVTPDHRVVICDARRKNHRFVIARYLVDHAFYVDTGTKAELARIDEVRHYCGDVHCLTVPGGMFYARNVTGGVWTGNSSRTGNKGIVSNTVPRSDMPYSADGTIMDVLVNAHSIPTRMATNQIIECLMGLLAVKRGCFIDATAFARLEVPEIVAECERVGIKCMGRQQLYSGVTGEPIDALIFNGPTTYQRLLKFVIDEHYSIRNGPISAIVKQPMDGMKHHGGLRIGEMEKDVLCAQGCMRFVFSKFYEDSDGMHLPVCRMCGRIAIANDRTADYYCNRCNSGGDIAQVHSSWAANASFQELSGANIKMSFQLEPLRFVETIGEK